MKKFITVIIIITALMLTGCSQGNAFDYNTELKALLKQVNDSKTGFNEDLLDSYLEKASSSYSLLLRSVWKSSSVELESAQAGTVQLRLVYWSYDDVYSKVTSDVSGFISDMQNLYDLGVSTDVINDYVYDYLVKMITDCNKESHLVQCTLTQYTEAPLIFSDNDSLLTDIEVSISKLVYDLEQYALNWEEPHTTTDASQWKYAELNKDYTTVLNYWDGLQMIPISIKVIDILQGSAARERVEGLSENNVGHTGDNIVYLEFEVHNYSGNLLVFDSRFYDADTKNLKLYESEFTYNGVPKQYNISSGSTTTIKDVIVFNHGDLVWYDEFAKEIYLLNLN